MEQERIILKNLRKQNNLKLDEAAKLTGRSKGSLSEIENGKGRSVLRPKEYKRLYDLYEGDKYKKYFGPWVKAATQAPKVKQKSSLDGAIYKFLRCKKAKLKIDLASQKIGISKGYLSKIENGSKIPSKELKEAILKVYGYSPNSWRNFASEDKRGKSIPIEYKLNILLRELGDIELLKVFEYALTL